jgi:hypothetical protein
MSGLTRLAAGALLGGALLPLLSGSPAAAVVVTVGGMSYDVSALTVSYNSQPSAFVLPPLGQMPWWGDGNLASEFATQVFNQLGSGWDADYGPVFAYALDTSMNQVLGLSQSLTDLNDQIDVTPTFAATSRYAIAVAPVPLPLPLLGAAAGLGWSRRLRLRTRVAAQEAFHAKTTTHGRPTR